MKLRVLHLPKWYPNRYDEQDGDFVARHIDAIAQAASVEEPLQTAVVFAAVARGPLSSLIEAEVELSGLVPTWRYYYRAHLTGFAWLDRMLKLPLWLVCISRGIRAVRQYWGNQKPDVVHVHVLLRTGAVALWLKWWQRVPYLITEHWTLYLPERASGISSARRWLTRFVLARAAGLHTVSESLRVAMHQLGFAHPRSVVIANVVDTNLFNMARMPRVPGQLLLVSAFHDAIKNISGVLRVVARLQTEWPGLRLRVAGYGPDEVALQELATKLGLMDNGTVAFLGKLPHSSVAYEMQRASALVSFSRAETFGCVFMEARATGCPVVGPITGGVPELFQPPNTFGLLVPPDDEKKLAQALVEVLAGNFSFDSAVLQADAEARCSYSAIATAFWRVYQQITHRT